MWMTSQNLVNTLNIDYDRLNQCMINFTIHDMLVFCKRVHMHFLVKASVRVIDRSK